jgi:glycosyltransferase involved in cell wall biosynthesis
VDIPNSVDTMATRIRPLRVCYFGTYRQEYSRNQIMIEGLRQAGVNVIECHESLWNGIEDRVQAASGGWLRPAFIWRVLCTYWHLIRRYFHVADFDIMVVGYPGQFDVFLARILTWLRKKALVWDIFMSIYLIAIERGLDKGCNRFSIDILRRLERLACRQPDLLILDTSEYVAWFGRTHSIPAFRFRLVPTGADDRIYCPIISPFSKGRTFRVIYYGSFIRNHGIKYILEAVRLLADDPNIQFELIGEGPELTAAQEFASRFHLNNINFVDWLEKPELVKRVAQANVCLGAFGITPQSLMTVQNKVYEGLAMAKPVITGDSPAIRHALIHADNVFLCKREDPKALVEAVQMLKNDPELCKRLGENGYRIFHEKFDLFHIGQYFTQHLFDAIDNR